MSTQTHLEIPAGGEKVVPGEPTPDHPIIPFIEGDGIGADITPVDARRSSTRPSRRPIGGTPRDQVDGDSTPARRPRPSTAKRHLAPRTRRSTRHADFAGLHQGPADDTRRRRNAARTTTSRLRQQLDLYVSPAPRSATSPACQRRCDDPSKTDMVIFRENSRRTSTPGSSGQARIARRPARSSTSCRTSWSVAQDPLPGDVEHRNQARLAGGHRAAGAQGDPVRARATGATRSRSCTRATS